MNNDKIKEIDALMYKVARAGARVRIVCNDGDEYSGIADYYTKADDEEDGYATVCVFPGNGYNMCLGSNEIKSIEIL